MQYNFVILLFSSSLCLSQFFSLSHNAMQFCDLLFSSNLCLSQLFFLGCFIQCHRSHCLHPVSQVALTSSNIITTSISFNCFEFKVLGLGFLSKVIIVLVFRKENLKEYFIYLTNLNSLK